MMRRLFDALVLPTVSYGSEVWGPFCSPTLPRDIKKMADVQIAFFRQLCRLKRSVTPSPSSASSCWIWRLWHQQMSFQAFISQLGDDILQANRYTPLSDLRMLRKMMLTLKGLFTSSEARDFLALLTEIALLSSQLSASSLLQHSWISCPGDACRAAGAHPLDP